MPAETYKQPLMCATCKHLRMGFTNTCAAFPKGIPDVMLTDGFDHRQPYPGDHGIRWEAAPGTAETVKILWGAEK